jgi:hypothetical protein
MKILITGNSQAGCLKRALDSSSEDQYPSLKKADWIVVPGGWGPSLKLNNERIEIHNFDPRHPPRYHPSESILNTLVGEYDLIVVSALGYIDGGFKYLNPISTIANISPAGLEVRDDSIAPVPVSGSCFYEIAAAKFCPGMVGFNFLRQLRNSFGGKIIVQPFPLLSEEILNRDDWHLARIYKDPVAANQFMLKIKDDFLSSICSELSCCLLSYPNSQWREAGFSPREYIHAYDCHHPTDSYGALILAQLESQICS